MLFFFVSLIVGIFGTAVLFYAFGRSIDRNHKRRNKRPIGYLAPVFLSLLLLGFSIVYTAPRLFDLVTLFSGNYMTNDVKLTNSQISWSSLIIEGQPYYYNPLQYKPQPATRYRLTTLPNSHHVISMEPIAENVATGGLNESGK